MPNQLFSALERAKKELLAALAAVDGARDALLRAQRAEEASSKKTTGG